MCEALTYLLDNIFIRFSTKLYRQIIGIPMGTNCAPLIADLFFVCYERDFITFLSYKKEAEISQAFNSTSRYIDDLLSIDNPYFKGMVGRIYPGRERFHFQQEPKHAARSAHQHLTHCPSGAPG